MCGLFFNTVLGRTSANVLLQVFCSQSYEIPFHDLVAELKRNKNWIRLLQERRLSLCWNCQSLSFLKIFHWNNWKGDTRRFNSCTWRDNSYFHRIITWFINCLIFTFIEVLDCSGFSELYQTAVTYLQLSLQTPSGQHTLHNICSVEENVKEVLKDFNIFNRIIDLLLLK